MARFKSKPLKLKLKKKKTGKKKFPLPIMPTGGKKKKSYGKKGENFYADGI